MIIMNTKRVSLILSVIMVVFMSGFYISPTYGIKAEFLSSNDNNEKKRFLRQIDHFNKLTDFSLNHSKLFWFRGRVLDVKDGDTYRVLIDKGQNEYSVKTVRLLGVDTPETFRRPSGMSDTQWKHEQAKGYKATSWVKDKIYGKEVLIKANKTGNFGRLLAKIQLPHDTKTINKQLIDHDLAEVNQ